MAGFKTPPKGTARPRFEVTACAEVRTPALEAVAPVLAVLPLLGLLILAAPAPALAQEQDPSDAPRPSTVDIRVLDSRTLQPVEGAEIRLSGTSHRGLTGPDGRLTLPDVPRGTFPLVLEHIAYGEHREEVEVTGTGVLRLDIRISQQALRLEPVVVEGRPYEEWSRERRGTSVRYIPREIIEQFEGTGVSLAHVIGSRLPGLDVSPSGCVESRRTSSLLPGNPCRQALVVVDRIPVNQPASILTGMPLHHVESVEYLSSSEAGVRYGSDAGYGVILITSRRPAAAPGESLRSGWRYPTYDWAQEEGKHPWKATLAGAMVGNALGLALSRPGRDCVSMEVGLGALCGQSPTTAQGIAGFLFPVMGASLGAQLMGSTEESTGTLRTTVLVSAAAMAVAYTVTTASNQHPITTGQRIGHGLVLIGVPVTAGLGNRYFRSLRNPPDRDPRTR
jgi:hypothetical protein